MQVTFWKFNKRINSTKVPTTTGITTNAVHYKDITDINKPIIRVSAINMNDGYNYAKIGTKYYYVNAVESMVRNIWIVNLTIDLLATYKSEILNTTAFVSRAGNGYNKYLLDDFNTATTKVNRTVIQAPYVDFYETGDGCYILEVNNTLKEGTVNSGFNAAYILTAEQMQEVASKLMTDQGFIEEMQKIFGAPIEAIISCHWMPLNYNTVCVQTGETTNVYIGSYDTGISAYLVADNFMETFSDFDLSPYITEDYLRNPKYTDIVMCIPYVGTVAIDVRQMVESSNGTAESKILRVRICIDVRSGKQLVMIVPQSYPNAPINSFETVICEERTISSATKNLAPMLYSVAAAIPMASMGGGWLAGSLSSVNTSLVESFRTNYSSVGTSGGSAFEGYGTACRCIILQREKSFEPLDESVRNTIGLPVNKAVLLSSLGNCFVQTINASVSLQGFYDETMAINSMLNGGVYIE